MRAWQVFERAVPVGHDPDVVLVKDGICWPALFVPLLWGLIRQQWLFVLAVLLAAAAITLGGPAIGAGPAVEAVLGLGLNIAAALFANDWRAWRLEAAGYRLVAVLGARNQATAERRWFTDFATMPKPAPARPRTPWLPLLGEA